MSEYDGENVEVVLEGGPVGLPSRMRLSGGTPLKIKLPYLGGHEHFEIVDDALRPRIYRWTMRTRIAE